MSLMVRIDCTNWRNERSIRRIKPLSLQWRKTKWHPDPKYMLKALDLDKNEIREFAMKDIHCWSPVE